MRIEVILIILVNLISFAVNAFSYLVNGNESGLLWCIVAVVTVIVILYQSKDWN